MNEQLRPVDGRQDTDALLREVGDIIRKAQAEYAGGFEVAGRLEITHAQRLLDRVFHGEAV